MTVIKEDNSAASTADIVVTAVPDTDAAMVTATAVAFEEKPANVGGGVGQGNEPPIPPGHARFYCSKCRAPYDLPGGATTWRCAGCHTFNSTTPGECEWCSIL